MKFLINTITSWEEPPRTRHFVTNSLSKKYPVVFIAANTTGMPGFKIEKINDNLTVITPSFPVDTRIRYRLPVVNEFYQNWLYKKLVGSYGDYEVINFDYTATRIFSYFKNIIYYVNDSFFEISKQINPLWIARYHQRCESKVAAGAKFCVCISPKIKEEISVYNKKIVEIPLGSPDIEQFNIRIKDVPSSNHPVKVILVAVIKKLNISHNILNALLEDETISVTLVGPIEEGFLDQIPKKERLVCKGALYDKALYEEINNYDVAIAPYCTETRNDIFTGTGGKIYHYLSMGKPVVITEMEGLKDLKLKDRMIYPADSPALFPALVHKAHQENSTKLIQQRIEWAQGNTWNKRMEDLVSFYQLQ